MPLTFNINEKISHDAVSKLFVCEKCGYSSNHKGDFNKHVNKKKPCNIENANDTIDTSIYVEHIPVAEPINVASNLNDNMSWLEQENKINNAMAIAEEARARTVALNMAISSIKDLSDTVKSLKSEVDTLKTELASVKQTNELFMQKRKWLTDEEKENIRPKIVEIIVNTFVKNYIGRGSLGMTPDKLYEITDMKTRIDIMSNVIINHSRNENECIRIANKISTLNVNLTKHVNTLMSEIDQKLTIGQNAQSQYLLFYDYKIIYFAFYEVQHYYVKISLTDPEINKIRYKSIEDGGLIFQ
jgi:hypothetical protein